MICMFSTMQQEMGDSLPGVLSLALRKHVRLVRHVRVFFKCTDTVTDADLGGWRSNIQSAAELESWWVHLASC